MGFKTSLKRTFYDRKTGMVPEDRLEKLMPNVRIKGPLIISVKHRHMLVIGFDDVKRFLYIREPSDPKMPTVDYTVFINRNSLWRRNNPDRSGWDGRYLAVWK